MAFQPGAVYPPKRTVGKPRTPSPKTCKCGLRGSVRDVPVTPQHVRRRYICVCGNRWTTYEVTIDEKEDAET